MEMGTTASPWRYEGTADLALRLANLRRPATLRFASRAAAFPISQGGPVTFDRGPFDRSARSI